MAYIALDVLNNEAQALGLGIDLGTTNSLGALWREGHPIVLRPPDGHGLVPSALYFEPDGRVLVGQEARERALIDPAHALFSIKRFMGRGLADLQSDLANVPCPVTQNENGVIQFEFYGKRYTPQQLSALILMKVHDQACRALGGADIRRAVITVPAYFDEAQRGATRDAARLAGLDLLRIVNEPTAASLAYGLDQKQRGTVVVYDLGGGTFDVSVLRIEDGVFRVLATAGDTHLGGDDFDRALAGAARAELAGELPPDVLADPAFRQLLRLAAERCKQELSTQPEGELHVALPESGVQWRRRVHLAEFEALIQPLVERTLDCSRRALADAGLGPAEIDEVVLVGGSTRVPLVRRSVEACFGRRPHTELNPDEVVALGAAVQAHVLVGGTRDILLMDVTPLSLGLETMGGAVTKLIARNTTIPAQATEGFTTYVDGQTGIDFNIVQGERELAADNQSLGRFKLTGIPPMPAGMARVAVRFHLDADGLLTVTAKEESTGAQAQISVQPLHGLTDAEVEGMLAEAYANARGDFEARRLADLKVELGTMLRACEKGLAQAGNELDRETRRDLEEAMQAARAAAAGTDLAAAQASRDALERASLPLAALLMDSVAKAALEGKTLDEL